MNTEKYYLLEKKKKKPIIEECVWYGKPKFLPFILGKENILIDTIILLGILWYFNFSRFIITDILILIYLIDLSISICRYFFTQYFITTTHFILRKWNNYYYYPINELEEKDYSIHFSLINWLFNCKTISYAYCKLRDVPTGVWVSTPRYATNSSNAWHNKAIFYCVRDYRTVYNYMNVSHIEYKMKKNFNELKNI